MVLLYNFQQQKMLQVLLWLKVALKIVEQLKLNEQRFVKYNHNNFTY